MREEFEAWAKSEGYDLYRPIGGYGSFLTRSSYEGWKAGRAALEREQADKACKPVTHPDEFVCPLCYDDPFNVKEGSKRVRDEPAVVAYMWQNVETGRIGFCDSPDLKGWEIRNPRLHIIGPLITLQSHREAMEKASSNADSYKTAWLDAYEFAKQQEEAIAQEDAALKACIEALENYDALIGSGLYKEAIPRAAAVMKADAAITQAKEALE